MAISPRIGRSQLRSLVRILRGVRPQSNGCWTWRQASRARGYGKVWLRRRLWSAHTAVWTCVFGPVPRGKELDHTCRNPACVNPLHMEPVTHAENTRRGVSPWGVNARKTHCPRGHAYTPENTYWFRNHRNPTRKYRWCRTCALAHQRKIQARRRAS